MPSIDRRVAQWMRAHHAIASNEQFAALGITEDQRRHLVGIGALERVVDGAYRFVGVAPDEMSRWAALCASRPELVIAGPSAGRYWNIPRAPRDGLVHVLAPPQSNPCREPWVRAYRTMPVDDADVITRFDGIRITTPTRAVVDLSRYVTNEEEATAIEHALNKGLCTYDGLAACAQRLNTRGRPWVRRFLHILDARRPGAPRESSWERRVHEALIARGVADLEAQVVETLPGHGNVRFDFAIPALRIVIEVDVHPEHRTVEGQASDSRRDRKSRGVGWVVERLAEGELTTDFDGTIDDVVQAIADRRAEVQQLNDVGLWPPRPTR